MRNAHDLANRHPLAAAQALFERFARHELHDHVRQLAVGRAFDLMHRHDVFMRDRRGRAGLAAKPLPSDFVFGQFRVEHFDCDVALQLRVERFQHHAHAAAADDPHDVKVRQPAEIRAVHRGARKLNDTSRRRPTSGVSPLFGVAAPTGVTTSSDFSAGQ
ncbi:MAG: hypothetical protein QM775_35830 [Pirellulales bacterium]